jgi:alkylhydroperoxidase family enzyme
MHLVNAHAPELAQARRGVTYALRNLCKVSRQIRELTILRTAILVEQQYEINHHIPMALKTGITEAQIEALKGDWRARADLFSDAQRAVLEYVDCLCLRRGDVPDATFEALAKHFSPREILEITHSSTNYWATGVFIRAMQIEHDPPTRTTAPGKF